MSVHSTAGPMRRAVAVTAVTFLAVAAGGCTPESPSGDPSPSATSAPHYGAIPPDMCERVAYDRAASEADLEVVEGHEPSESDISYGRIDESVSCTVSASAADGRFATTTPFTPSIVAGLRVFDDAAGAQEHYAQRTAPEANPVYAPDGATSTSVEGWWDRGTSFTAIIPVDDPPAPGGPDAPDPPTTRIEVAYLVQHENLYLQVPANEVVPTDEVDDARAVLHALARAFADAFVAPLRPSPTPDS